MKTKQKSHDIKFQLTVTLFWENHTAEVDLICFGKTISLKMIVTTFGKTIRPKLIVTCFKKTITLKLIVTRFGISH